MTNSTTNIDYEVPGAECMMELVCMDADRRRLVQDAPTGDRNHTDCGGVFIGPIYEA
ncbi:MAG: hypothetical protein K9L62_03270 [Vallitaleaceae bacterium]|nr:hypothetical protein [Vallitaleaceae bacterium]